MKTASIFLAVVMVGSFLYGYGSLAWRILRWISGLGAAERPKAPFYFVALTCLALSALGQTTQGPDWKPGHPKAGNGCAEQLYGAVIGADLVCNGKFYVLRDSPEGAAILKQVEQARYPLGQCIVDPGTTICAEPKKREPTGQKCEPGFVDVLRYELPPQNWAEMALSLAHTPNCVPTKDLIDRLIGKLREAAESSHSLKRRIDEIDAWLAILESAVPVEQYPAASESCAIGQLIQVRQLNAVYQCHGQGNWRRVWRTDISKAFEKPAKPKAVKP